MTFEILSAGLTKTSLIIGRGWKNVGYAQRYVKKGVRKLTSNARAGLPSDY